MCQIWFSQKGQAGRDLGSENSPPPFSKWIIKKCILNYFCGASFTAFWVIMRDNWMALERKRLVSSLMKGHSFAITATQCFLFSHRPDHPLPLSEFPLKTELRCDLLIREKWCFLEGRCWLCCSGAWVENFKRKSQQKLVTMSFTLVGTTPQTWFHCKHLDNLMP